MTILNRELRLDPGSKDGYKIREYSFGLMKNYNGTYCDLRLGRA